MAQPPLSVLILDLITARYEQMNDPPSTKQQDARVEAAANRLDAYEKELKAKLGG